MYLDESFLDSECVQWAMMSWVSYLGLRALNSFPRARNLIQVGFAPDDPSC
jgi:hypothetical protein